MYDTRYVNKLSMKKAPCKKSPSRQGKAGFLSAINKLSPTELDSVIPYLSSSGCSAIYECVHNVLRNSNIPNKSKLRKLLLPHKNNIRYLVDGKNSSRARRGKLTEVGGAIIAPILAAAVPFLIDMVAKAIKG